MGRRATCYDNAVSESFFATYKKELIHPRPWNDLTEVRQHTFLWIEGYYDRRRRELVTHHQGAADQLEVCRAETGVGWAYPSRLAAEWWSA